jgi:hypothetical protein
MQYLRYGFNFLSAGFFLLLGWGLALGPSADWSVTGHAGVAFLSGVVCALIGNLDRIEMVRASLSGIEAKTREAAIAVEQARVAQKEFHILAEMTGKLLIEGMASSGRMGSGPIQYDEQRREDVVRALRAVGLDDGAVRRVRAGDKYWVSIDYSLGILRTIKKSPLCSEDLKRSGSEMLGRWNREDFRPTPSDFEAVLRVTPCEDQSVVELVRDYQYYVQHEQHRRPDVWMNRKVWLSQF